MGKRRIRLLKQFIQENELSEKGWNVVGIDISEKRREECNRLLGVRTYMELENAITEEAVQCVIISSIPQSHSAIINLCLQHNLHVFTEINLSSEGYRENISLAKEKEKTLFLSFTFMYRKEVEYIKKRIAEKDFKGVYHYHVGQYLPDWHPWESYKSYFIGNKETNGCREIMAIDLPWLIDIFGEVKSYTSIHSKKSNLEIDYDDTYQIVVEHESGATGTIIIDVVTPKVERKLEMWQENFYLSWEGTPDFLQEYDNVNKELIAIPVYNNYERKKEYNHSIIEDAYYEEIVNFMEIVFGNGKPRYTFEEDEKILSLIDGIEK